MYPGDAAVAIPVHHDRRDRRARLHDGGACRVPRGWSCAAAEFARVGGCVRSVIALTWIVYSWKFNDQVWHMRNEGPWSAFLHRRWPTLSCRSHWFAFGSPRHTSLPRLHRPRAEATRPPLPAERPASGQAGARLSRAIWRCSFPTVAAQQ